MNALFFLGLVLAVLAIVGIATTRRPRTGYFEDYEDFDVPHAKRQD